MKNKISTPALNQQQLKNRVKHISGLVRMFRLSKLLPAFLLMCSFSVLAQQDPLFSQYMFNKLLVNPAYAGSREVFTVELLDRYQWVGVDGAPKTISLSAHTAISKNKVGLGGFVFRDVIGPTINQGFMATYAYRIRTKNGWFSMGLQGGIKYFDIDWNMIKTKTPDEAFYPDDIRKVTPDLDLGLYYQTTRFFAGVSSKHLLGNEYGLSEVEGKTSYSILARHFYALSGLAIPLNDKMVFRPSMMAKYAQGSTAQFDLNASVLFSDIFWIGISYRTEKAVVFLTEFWITNKIRLGYAFDLYYNSLQLNNKGSHEIRLGFDIGKSKYKMKTPRYF